MVIAPALAFVMTTLLLSCGGSSTSNSLPAPTATPITLIVMRVCAQPPSTGAACTQATTAKIPLSAKNYEFYAQGEFSSNGISTFQNISQSATWFVNNSLLTSEGQGFYTAGATIGCTCITAASGTVVSPPVLIGVGQPASACSPCPPSPPSQP
ncbi:MAG TPA: hypothetical protein VNE82_06605 [Candidatus Binataceae bacterium]|nr:hypothetical protein [Candidatus Binataceae bacterium]